MDKRKQTAMFAINVTLRVCIGLVRESIQTWVADVKCCIYLNNVT